MGVVSGSSPRVRGTARARNARRSARRFIPACAGNSRSASSVASTPPVHPRVCGEQPLSLHPRQAEAGSSPRVRGTARSVSASMPRRRFIPACAGNSPGSKILASLPPVHPRVCGEQARARAWVSSSFGSSPRVRGTVPYDLVRDIRQRFIPACAGNRASAPSRSGATTVHPRVCGEQYRQVSCLISKSGSSPRVRGTVRHRRFGDIEARFIPACAGNSAEGEGGRPASAVHPRVCGEQSSRKCRDQRMAGSSPRVRGTGRPSCGC